MLSRETTQEKLESSGSFLRCPFLTQRDFLLKYMFTSKTKCPEARDYPGGGLLLSMMSRSGRRACISLLIASSHKVSRFSKSNLWASGILVGTLMPYLIIVHRTQALIEDIIKSRCFRVQGILQQYAGSLSSSCNTAYSAVSTG